MGVNVLHGVPEITSKVSKQVCPCFHTRNSMLSCHYIIMDNCLANGL